jgi:uncharacterized membrane protein
MPAAPLNPLGPIYVNKKLEARARGTLSAICELKAEEVTGRSHRFRAHIRPVHPPFTHFPIAAYVFAAGFDITSAAAGARYGWAGQLWHAGTFVLIGGLIICLITMATGFWDLIRQWPGNSGALADDAPDQLRTVAAHISVMAAAFMIGAGDVAWRLSDYGSRASTPLGVVALSLTAAIVACAGGYFGGKLVFDHAIGVTPAEVRANSRLPAGRVPDDHEQAGVDVTGRRTAGWDGRGATRGDTAP